MEGLESMVKYVDNMVLTETMRPILIMPTTTILKKWINIISWKSWTPLISILSGISAIRGIGSMRTILSAKFLMI